MLLKCPSTWMTYCVCSMLWHFFYILESFCQIVTWSKIFFSLSKLLMAMVQTRKIIDIRYWEHLQLVVSIFIAHRDICWSELTNKGSSIAAVTTLHFPYVCPGKSLSNSSRTCAIHHPFWVRSDQLIASVLVRQIVLTSLKQVMYYTHWSLDTWNKWWCCRYHYIDISQEE
jgi:hypothetical protein